MVKNLYHEGAITFLPGRPAPATSFARLRVLSRIRSLGWRWRSASLKIRAGCGISAAISALHRRGPPYLLAPPVPIRPLPPTSSGPVPLSTRFQETDRAVRERQWLSTDLFASCAQRATRDRSSLYKSERDWHL